MKIRSDFAYRLQHLIDEKKINQKEFSKESGFSETQVSKWINRVVESPRRSTIAKIASYFGCSTDWLATGKGEIWPHTPPIHRAHKSNDKRPSMSTTKNINMDMCCNMDNFHERLQYLAKEKKINQAKLSSGLDKNRSTVSKWWKGKITPALANQTLIADFFGCSQEWLATGKGEIWPHKPPQGDQVNFDFGTFKREKDLSNEKQLEELRFFKQQCLGFFDELFDFVAEYYGPNKEGAERFLEDLHTGFSNYREFIREKKAARENIQTEKQDNLIVNQK